MSLQQTSVAIEAFEAARAAMPQGLQRNLELGVLYLADRKLDEARTALDRVSPSDRAYPLALFASAGQRSAQRARQGLPHRSGATPCRRTTRELINRGATLPLAGLRFAASGYRRLT